MFAGPVLITLCSVKAPLQAHITQVQLLYSELYPNVKSGPQRTLYFWVMMSPAVSARC